ncbi:hypothetical protein E2562_018002, partial [Oryza meyeriana var. granulata]
MTTHAWRGLNHLLSKLSYNLRVQQRIRIHPCLCTAVAGCAQSDGIISESHEKLLQ